MILEHAILPVIPAARPSPNAYLLLVHRESLEAREQGFRGSPEYARWSESLHELSEPFPVVEHFTEVLSTPA